MKNQAIKLILCCGVCIIIHSGLCGAVEPITTTIQECTAEQPALTPLEHVNQHAKVAGSIAAAIVHNNADEIKKIFSQRAIVRSIWIYKDPEEAKQHVRALGETVKKNLLASGDERLNYLNNDAGKLFINVLNQIKKMIETQLSRCYSMIEELPEHVHKIIGGNLLPTPLSNWAPVSRREYGYVQDMLNQKRLLPSLWLRPLAEPIMLKGEGKVISLLFAHGGNALVAVQNRAVRLWNLETRESIVLFELEKDEKCSIACSPVDSLLVFASRQRGVRLYDLSTAGFTPLPIQIDQDSPPIAFASDGSSFTVAKGGYICLAAVKNKKVEELEEVKVCEGSILSVVFVPNNKILVAAFSPEPLQLDIWQMDIATKARAVKETMIAEKPSEVVLSPDGTTVTFSLTSRHLVLVWNLLIKEKKKIKTFRVLALQGLMVSPDGTVVGAVSDNGVFIWDVELGTLPRILRLDGLRTAVFSADGKKVAAGSNNGSIAVWQGEE